MNDRKVAIAVTVIELAAEQGGVDPGQVFAATHFVNDLNYDSLDLVEFTMSLEDEFEMSVPDDAAMDLRTVEQVVDYVMAHQTVAVVKVE